jgi:hypothetical protein
MSIEVKCPGCFRRYAVADQFAGKKAKCKACGAMMLVPQLPPPPPVEREMDFDALAAMESGSPVDNSAPIAVAPPPLSPPISAPPRRPVPVAPFAKPKPASSRFRLGFRLNRLVIAMLVIGVMLIVYGFKEWRLASASGSTPQTITCAQLEANGYGNNAYIRLTGFKVSGHFVYNKRSDDYWTVVWLPIVSVKSPLPAADGSGPTGPVKVIIKSNKIHNHAEAEAFAINTSIEGMVINQIESISSKETELLRHSYPTTDFDKCWIVEEGREPAGAGKYMAFFGGGALLVLAGLGMMFGPE